jgi:hypothetical protein
LWHGECRTARMRHVTAANQLVNLAADIPTEFPDEQ